VEPLGRRVTEAVRRMNRALHRKWIVENGAPVACPYCGSSRTERSAAFGPFHMTEPYVCRECGSPFSRIRWRASADPETDAGRA
jgi:DNA-directed RNA polymerase subunit RPC12/RpoP